MRAFFHNARGSMTLEVSIWFPVLLLMIITSLLTGMMIYARVTLYTMAEQTAERASYVWDNSYKDAVTGNLEAAKRDGLYWRLSSDGTLPFLAGGAGNPVTVLIPQSGDDGGASLAERKLMRSSRTVPFGISGELQYENKTIEKIVTAKLRLPFQLPPYFRRLFGYEHKVTASSIVADPVEYIRGIDLIRTYTGFAKKFFTPAEASSLFQEPTSYGQNADVSSELEAARWLRLHTSGKRQVMETTLGNRMIDSLTADLTAHQAYYTYTERQIMEQAHKDAELLAKGEVKQVVWHFFLGRHNRNPEPSAQLVRQLEQYGFRIEIHAGGGE